MHITKPSLRHFSSHINPPPLLPLSSQSTCSVSSISLPAANAAAAMVVLSQPVALDNFPNLIKKCKPTTLFTAVPVVDLTDPDAKHHIVKACQDYGLFKVVNHGVPLDFMTTLEAEALKFFNLPQSEKEKAGPADPFGYGSKRIGPNGDIGWVEYILLNTNPDVVSHKSLSIFKDNPETFRLAVDDYISAVKKMAYEVVEMVADGLGIEPRNALSRMLKDEKADTCFRLNYYPPCPTELEALSGRNLIGFGEHTDPQIISVLRSNNTSSLQISLKDGTWVTVPPDQTSFFINVGDCLQVMTNGRFRSVKHRVIADIVASRISMIYFGGPPLSDKIAPLPSLMAEGEESLYKEFTWSEYKKSAYRSRLADYRLGFFEKK